ncbi:MAG: hypothetical protein ACRED0_10710 [Gammaproteobacteria bacterium]
MLEFLLAIIIVGMLLVTQTDPPSGHGGFTDGLQIEDSERVIAVVVSTVRGMSLGQVGASFLEGVLAAIGFFIAGVPGVVLLVLLTFLVAAAQIPQLLIVIAPAALWLYFQGEEGWSLFLLIWALVTIDFHRASVVSCLWTSTGLLPNTPTAQRLVNYLASAAIRGAT